MRLHELATVPDIFQLIGVLRLLSGVWVHRVGRGKGRCRVTARGSGPLWWGGGGRLVGFPGGRGSFLLAAFLPAVFRVAVLVAVESAGGDGLFNVFVAACGRP